MSKSLTLILILCLTASSYSQILRESFGYIDFTNVHAINYSSYEGRFLDEIDGSLYLNENIDKGYFLDTALKNKVQVNLRYDSFNDVFKIYPDLNSEEFKLLERTSRFAYELNGERFIIITSDVLNVGHFKHGKGYVVELTNPLDGVALYKRYHKKLDSGSVAASSYENDIFPSLNPDIFYIIEIDGQYLRIEAHKKKILEVFPKNKQNKIKEYIKSQDIKFKGNDKEVENQMIKVISYYNTI